MRKFVVVVAIAALLPGCMLGPNYRRPELAMPEQWRFEDPAAADTANTRWWTQFGDPVLDSLVQEALPGRGAKGGGDGRTGGLVDRMDLIGRPERGRAGRRILRGGRLNSLSSRFFRCTTPRSD